MSNDEKSGIEVEESNGSQSPKTSETKPSIQNQIQLRKKN